MNCINPDSCIARKNIERFELTGKMDINYLSQLSDDAIPVIIEALNDLDDNLKKNSFMSCTGGVRIPILQLFHNGNH